MFDPISAALLRSAPGVRGLTSQNIPRLLTLHYANLVSARLRGASDDLAQAGDLWPLERIADTYELITSLSSDGAIRAASAFVAGTAQQILARRYSADAPPNSNRPNIDRDRVEPAISAALLFLAAEQYADAYEAASGITPRKETQTYEAAILSENVVDLAQGHLPEIIDRAGRWRRSSNRRYDLEAHALAALLETVITGIEMLAADFLGVAIPEPAARRFDTPRDAFVRVVELSGVFMARDDAAGAVLHTYPGPHHLASLLIAVADSLSPAALTKVPPPEGADPEVWHKWLNLQAKRHPFIWRNHRKAIADGFHETGKSAVVVLPTGAGKTTVSAVKIAGVLARGRKVVFLAPTHALVEQLTEDLQVLFPEEILGSAVTSDFDLLFQSDSKLSEIEVMTPERCLAMLSFAPDAFSDVGLLVFDECHLLAPQQGKIRRSLDAMLCLLGFTHVAPDADLLFLSAMLKNADEFASWVGDLTGRKCVCVDLLWKPSRQARGVVIYKEADLRGARESAAATQHAEDAISRKMAKNLRDAAAQQLKVPAFAIWGLQHNWLEGRTAHCSIQPVLDEPVLLTGKIQNDSIALKPNANKVAARLAVAAARNGLKTIVFVNTKSDAITVARDIAGELGQDVHATEAENDRWQALQAELGDLRHAALPQPAVAVPHNSSMLRLERDLAERMFKRSNGAMVIVATPTLAQGLNLPAHLAVLAGDKRADALRPGRESLEAHEILNAAARAGRAGHVANGVVLLIPEPIISYSGGQVPSDIIRKLKSVLPEDDRCVIISDPLEIVLDRVTNGNVFDPDARYLINRMAALNVSEGGEESDSLFDLRRSLGAFAARSRAAEAEFEARITDLRAAIYQTTPEGVDASLAMLASRSGLSMQLFARLRKRLADSATSWPHNVEAWVEWTLEWLSEDSEARDSLLRDVNRAILGACGLRKDGDVTPAELKLILPGLRAWINGRPLAEIELELGGDPQGATFTKQMCPRARELVGTVIPRGLSFVAGLVSHVAGETNKVSALQGLDTVVVESLATAVRKGYDTPEKVAFAGEHKAVLSRVQIHRLFTQHQAQ